MGARTKLNNVHVGGSIVLAGLVGIVTGSWLIFAVTGATLIASGVYLGNIRPNGKKRR